MCLFYIIETILFYRQTVYVFIQSHKYYNVYWVLKDNFDSNLIVLSIKILIFQLIFALDGLPINLKTVIALASIVFLACNLCNSCKLGKDHPFCLQVWVRICVHVCSDHCPAPFSYSVRQKGYFHPFPLTVGILSPLISLLSCLFTFFHLFKKPCWYNKSLSFD